MAKQMNNLVDFLFKKGKECVESVGKEAKPVRESISDSTGEIGSIDYPIDAVSKDKLFINAQVKGLTEFLRTCDTPMTIAIQGSWGAGKSSYAELIQEQLHNIYGEEFDGLLEENKEKYEELAKQMEKSGKKLDKEALREKYIEDSCPFICFNSWKFTQFNLSNQLLTNMVASLTLQLENGIEGKKEKEKSDDILRLMNNLARFGGVMLNSAIKDKTGLDISGTAEQADWKGASAKETDYITLINKLQYNFQQLIYERLGITAENKDQPEYKKKRVIFFVDDLDRLSPDKAIDVLEVLKLFLDCKHCVFLLAIDYDVVVNGVKLKYKNSLGEEKGKEFFEKMIQVVYTLPSYLSRTDEYVKDILVQNKQSPLLAAEFAGLMKSGRKNNPRSIKRLINSFVLLEKMKMSYDNKPLSTESAIMLFSALCLQNICPEVFAFWNESFNDTVYDYKKGVEWFNEFIDFCNGVLIGKNTAKDWKRPYELSQMALYEDASENRLNRTKIQFLAAFFKKIHDTAIRKSCYGDSLSDGGKYEIKDVLNLRNALQLTVAENSFINSRLGSIIPLIRIGYEQKYIELKEGSSKEAYLRTVQGLLEKVDKNNSMNESNNRQFGWRKPVYVVADIVAQLEWMLSMEAREDGEWEPVSYGEKTLYLLVKPPFHQQLDEQELAIWRANNTRALAKKLNISFEWLAFVNGEKHTIYEYHEIQEFFVELAFEVSFVAFERSVLEMKSRKLVEAYYQTVSACMQDLLEAEGWDAVNEVIQDMDFLYDEDDLQALNKDVVIRDIVNDWRPEDKAVSFVDGERAVADSGFGINLPGAEIFEDDLFLEEGDISEDDVLLGEENSVEEDDFAVEEDFWENAGFAVEGDEVFDEEWMSAEADNDTETETSWYPEYVSKENGAVWSAVADEEGQRDYYIYTDISTFQMLENLEILTNRTKTQYVWYKDPYMIDEVVHGYWENRRGKE